MKKKGQGWPLFLKKGYTFFRFRIAIVAFSSLLSLKLMAISSSSVLLDSSGRFIDQFGRRLLLRGINVGSDSKIPPYRSIDGKHDLELLNKLGMNVIRLLFNWEAYAPEENKKNHQYLEHIKQVIQWAKELDILVILDFHQDAYSRFNLWGCGDGFPRWAMAHPVWKWTPKNDHHCKRWGKWLLIDHGLHRTWDAFYQNRNNVMVSFKQMVLEVLDLLSHYDNFLGVDILNEPWGNERSEISPFYHKMTKAIRDQGFKGFIFLTPHPLSAALPFKSRLIKPNDQKIVFSSHLYDATLITLKKWAGISPWWTLRKMLRKANNWRSGLFIGEFGAPADGSRTNIYMEEVYRYFNNYFVSGTQWVYTAHWHPLHKDRWNDEDFSIMDDKKRLRANFRPRAYATKVAGIPYYFRDKIVSRKEDKSVEGHLDFKWTHEPEKGSTEFYVPAFENNPLPIILEKSDSLFCWWKKINYLVCSSDKKKDLHVLIKYKTVIQL